MGTGAVDWWKIRIEPMLLPRGRPVASRVSYTLCLPLIADGRISLPTFRADRELATVERCRPNHHCDFGRIELRDNQWTCAWPHPACLRLADVRILAPRFLLGDLVGMRPLGGTMALFRIQARDAMEPAAPPRVMLSS
jgi:hypothetical protein